MHFPLRRVLSGHAPARMFYCTDLDPPDHSNSLRFIIVFEQMLSGILSTKTVTAEELANACALRGSYPPDTAIAFFRGEFQGKANLTSITSLTPRHGEAKRVLRIFACFCAVYPGLERIRWHRWHRKFVDERICYCKLAMQADLHRRVICGARCSHIGRHNSGSCNQQL